MLPETNRDRTLREKKASHAQNHMQSVVGIQFALEWTQKQSLQRVTELGTDKGCEL